MIKFVWSEHDQLTGTTWRFWLSNGYCHMITITEALFGMDGRLTLLIGTNHEGREMQILAGGIAAIEALP